jgi:hypothetical protein
LIGKTSSVTLTLLRKSKKRRVIHGIPFEGKTVVLKEQAAAFFEVSPRTVDNYIEKYSDELRQNGYEVLRGNQLKELKIEVQKHFGHEMDFATKTTVLGVFDFRAFLNLSMLIVESERARLLRRAILDIVIDTINQRTGGGAKYINQRDDEFLQSWFEEENYRSQFTEALKDCVDMGNFKYSLYTNEVYVSIFREKAMEYRKVLRLHERDKTVVLTAFCFSPVWSGEAVGEGFGDEVVHHASTITGTAI